MLQQQLWKDQRRGQEQRTVVAGSTTDPSIGPYQQRTINQQGSPGHSSGSIDSSNNSSGSISSNSRSISTSNETEEFSISRRWLRQQQQWNEWFRLSINGLHWLIICIDQLRRSRQSPSWGNQITHTTAHIQHYITLLLFYYYCCYYYYSYLYFTLLFVHTQARIGRCLFVCLLVCVCV